MRLVVAFQTASKGDEPVSRERLLILYGLLLGGSGWICLLLPPWSPIPLTALFLFTLLALAMDALGVRVPPADPHSMSGLVPIAAALVFGPFVGALSAACAGMLFGVFLPIIYSRPRTFYTTVARPLLRSGTRAAGIIGGSGLATTLAAPAPPALWLLFGCLVLGHTLGALVGRLGRELIQGGKPGVQTWWRSTWRYALGLEVAPLPIALLLAKVYHDLPIGYFLLTSCALIAVSVVVRLAVINVQTQRRSVRELALLNEASRAIIRSELNVEALCDLIYREASKVVDTASFHLGLFDGPSYTLMVRVQDRVRLPRLVVNLEAGDGIIGWVRETGRALLVEDFAREMDHLPARPRYQSERPPRSGIYVPLIAGDQVIGSISVQSYRASAFDANDLRLLSLIADQAAVVITRARAFNQARQRAVQLQAIHEVSERITAILSLEQLLPSVVRLIREHFNYHPVHIFTIEQGSDLIVFRASTSHFPDISGMGGAMRMGQGIVGSAAANAEPILVGDVRTDPRYIRDTSTTRSELAVPLRIGDQVIGVLDVQSDQVDNFDAEDLFVIRTLADQIAVAIDSANSYTAQQEEAWMINALLQVSENIGRATDLAELLPTLVRLPPLLAGCDRCGCLLLDRAHDEFVLVAAYGLSRAQRPLLLQQRIAVESARMLTHIRNELTPVIRAEAQRNPADLAPWIEVTGCGTIIVLPILARASLLGALIVDYDAPNQLLSTRQSALYTGALSQMAAALESALLAREAAEAAQFEQELRVAREIQTTLLPAAVPHIAGWQIAADWRSARLVGGDFYDFWFLKKPLNDPVTDPPETTLVVPTRRDLGFVIADVSDKGVPAAMFMALSRSLVRAAALDGSPTSTALERANRWITRDSESGMFVTLFYGILDTASGELCYTCAGHNPPLVYRATTHTFYELSTQGIALGVIEEIHLRSAKITLEPGDVLVCYTDGVTEAIDDTLDPFDLPRLREVIIQTHAESADGVLLAITNAVDRHTSGQPPFDDITLLVVKRENGESTT